MKAIRRSALCLPLPMAAAGRGVQSRSLENRTFGLRLEAGHGIIEARQCGRLLAARAGFSPTDRALISTAISELARYTLRFATRGDIVVSLVRQGTRQGVTVTASGDRGSADIALEGGATPYQHGLGLPGVKRLMDEFEILLEVGQGTTIVATKWAR